MTWPSSIIGLKSFLNFRLAVCQRRKEEKAAKNKKILEFDSKVAKNKVFISILIFLDYFFLKRDNINIKDKANN